MTATLVGQSGTSAKPCLETRLDKLLVRRKEQHARVQGSSMHGNSRQFVTSTTVCAKRGTRTGRARSFKSLSSTACACNFPLHRNTYLVVLFVVTSTNYRSRNHSHIADTTSLSKFPPSERGEGHNIRPGPMPLSSLDDSCRLALD
jgi:hypothetical protein